WKNFGKMFYIDQFLGNEDRFETMKIQNIFINPETFEVVALDNDTQAPEYISTITQIDEVTTPNNRTETQTNISPNDYIRGVIEGGWLYNNTALQARMLASLDEISGRSGELGQKIDQKVTTFLQTLLAGVSTGNSVNDKA